jgi:hypothetical protein
LSPRRIARPDTTADTHIFIAANDRLYWAKGIFYWKSRGTVYPHGSSGEAKSWINLQTHYDTELARVAMAGVLSRITQRVDTHEAA